MKRDVGMINQQKRGEQGVIGNPICLKRCRDWVTYMYDSRPFLVHLVLLIYHPYIPLHLFLIFTLVARIFMGTCARTPCYIRACAIKTTPILELA